MPPLNTDHIPADCTDDEPCRAEPREVLEAAAGALLGYLRSEFDEFGVEYKTTATRYGEDVMRIVKRAATGDLDRDVAADAIENYWLAARSDLARGFLAFRRRATANRGDVLVKSLVVVLKAVVPLLIV